jgi:hypothetical protein
MTTIFSNATGGLETSGMVDEIGYWERDLSSSEVTTLYNAGAGLTYPFISAAQPAIFMGCNF